MGRDVLVRACRPDTRRFESAVIEPFRPDAAGGMMGGDVTMRRCEEVATQSLKVDEDG